MEKKKSLYQIRSNDGAEKTAEYFIHILEGEFTQCLARLFGGGREVFTGDA